MPRAPKTALVPVTDEYALAAPTVDEQQRRDWIELIKTQICKGATDDELKMFIQVCDRTGLDPFARQIYAVQRYNSAEGKNVMTVQVSVDGLRVIAERSGKYQGQVGPQYCSKDGVWKDAWLEPGAPSAARVGILRKDFSEPLFAVARWDSYKSLKADGNLMPMWAKMPDVMLAKVAESLALRRAFPQDLSGLYSPEEMNQSGSEVIEANYTEVPYGSQTLSKANSTERLKLAEDLRELGVPGKEALLSKLQVSEQTLYTMTFDQILNEVKEKN